MAYKNISSNRQWFRAFVCLLIAISFLIVSVAITFIPILMAADYDARVKRFNETGEELNKKAEWLILLSTWFLRERKKGVPGMC